MSDAPLWTPAALEAATGGRLIGAPRAVTGASIDTRSLEPGDLFFAIRGEARDGHDFVRAALEKGAGAAVPRLMRRAPLSRAASRVASSRMPPDSSMFTFRNCLMTLRRIGAFVPRPKAASRSTRWIQLAPCDTHSPAASRGSP